MSEKMKLGFIGCGGFSSGNHIPNAAANPEFEIRAFCDLNKAHLEELSAKYKPSYITDDMEKVISDPEVELVICGTKPDFRLPIMKLAVKHKKHLFVEKPLCFKEEEVNEMVSLMNKAPIKFMVGFNRPYSPMMQDLKPLYNKNKKGNTTIIFRIVGEGQLWPAHHYNAVMRDKESTIIHEITHIFDLLNWLTDLYPQRVYTAGEGNVDNVITLNYPDNITAVIIAGDNSTAGFPKERIEINTNYGTIVGDHFVELSAIGYGKPFYKTYDYKIAGKTYNTSGLEAAKKCEEWRSSVTEEEIKKGYYYERQVKVDKGHYNELDIFRKIIRAGGASQTDVIKGAVANLIAWRAIESWEKAIPVNLDFSYLEKL
ncbi:MAG: hypothetical protein A2017_14645 [Lentisphaerae bacterium GWF2_44_16]|nr:MAG: hypothetical protein A2017_14645 [Lentisphaerae bacterium GWF2_44_16]